MRTASKEEWDEFIAQCSGATFFHSFEWYSIWSNYTGQSFEGRIFEVEGKTIALLPLLIGKALKGLLKTCTTSPGGTYGGYLVAGKISDSNKKELNNYLEKIKHLSYYQNPFDSVLDKEVKWTGETYTQVINLKSGWENIFSSWSKGHSSAAKKGIKRGIEIRQGKLEDWPKYFELYQETLQRWGEQALDKYDWRFFKYLSALSVRKCKLWLAWFEEKPIAGCICFYQNNHVVYWHGASTNRFIELRPAQVLQYFIIQDAIQKGYQWYDFNPSADLQGVIQFKKGFGTQLLPMKFLEKQPIYLELVSKMLRR